MFSQPSTFRRHTARQPFAAISSAGLKNWPPALFTSTIQPAVALEHRPHDALRLIAVAHVARKPVGAVPAPTRSLISAAAASSTSPRRPTIVTRAPQRTSSSALALPRPVPPPVTSATWPSSSPGANTSERSRALSMASDHRRRASVPRTRLGLVLVSHRPLVFVSGLTVADYLLWNWSLNSNHDVLALVSGLTLPPLAVAVLWLLSLAVARLIARSARRPTGRARRSTAASGRSMRRRRAARAGSPLEEPAGAVTASDASSRKLAA